MIFDSPQMIELRNKYQDLPNYEVPDVVFLDRFDDYAGERLYLEKLFSIVSTSKQKDWIGRFVNINSQQHIGVWFEIMLYGWLVEHFDVVVEPEILGNYPDFVLNISKQQLAIDARAFLVPPEERERREKINRIMSALGSIQKSFSVNLKIMQLGDRIRINEFIKEVDNWLDTNANQNLDYKDGLGNILRLSATPRQALKKVGVISSGGLRVNPDVLKAPLREKAKQHKALRKAGFPYVIAIFLEPSHLSAEEVVEAWLGRTTIVYDVDTDQVVEEKVDESGIHFFGKEIRHKSVTGTLVFRSCYDEARKSRYLQSWYVQNPYANLTIDPAIFPTESRYVVIGQDDEVFKMKWVK
jgi:hypothetical protein